MSVREHYEQHLATFYSWMIGNFEVRQLEQQKFFIEHNILPRSTARALDLGAAHGLQSISLAALGFSVIAVDFNRQLLNELDQRKKTYPIEIVEDDMVRFLKNYSEHSELIICMGDTLTHLEDIDQVDVFIQEIAKHLDENGRVIFSFRNYLMPLQGEERFIAVKSDDKRILTCFLEYFPESVKVHDILHENREGTWTQKVSAYNKLRLSEEQIMDKLTNCGITIIHRSLINGMGYIIGEKRVVSNAYT